jgi:uncharacterized protein (DUF2344 family)
LENRTNFAKQQATSSKKFQETKSRSRGKHVEEGHDTFPTMVMAGAVSQECVGEEDQQKFEEKELENLFENVWTKKGQWEIKGHMSRPNGH